MTVCSKRTDNPGFFTSCWEASGHQGCPCGKQVEAELVAQAVIEEESA